MSKLKSEINNNNNDNQSLVLEEGAASLNDIYDKAFIGGQEGALDYDNNNKNDEKVAIDDNELSPSVQQLREDPGLSGYNWKEHILPLLKELKDVRTTADVKYLAEVCKIVEINLQSGEKKLQDEIFKVIEGVIPGDKKKQFEEEKEKPFGYLSNVSVEPLSREIDK